MEGQTKTYKACGCRIFGDKEKHYDIEYCFKHKAAQDMYEALEKLLTLHVEDCKMLDRGIGSATPRGQKISRARQALALAEGRTP
mgnify:CR=1 FL=1